MKNTWLQPKSLILIAYVYSDLETDFTRSKNNLTIYFTLGQETSFRMSSKMIVLAMQSMMTSTSGEMG